MPEKADVGAPPWVDPDDPPELTDALLERADVYKGGVLVRRGRPPTGAAKLQVTVRLDRDVMEALRGSGPGWQSRVNEILRKAVGL